MHIEVLQLKKKGKIMLKSYLLKSDKRNSGIMMSYINDNIEDEYKNYVNKTLNQIIVHLTDLDVKIKPHGNGIEIVPSITGPGYDESEYSYFIESKIIPLVEFLDADYSICEL